MKFLFDFFPVLLFFISYKLYDIFVATSVGIAATCVQVTVFWVKHHRFEKMHLVSLGLIVLFGGATLWLKDPVFIKWKPTVLNWLFAVVFLGSQFIGGKTIVERIMGKTINVPDPVWLQLNLSWVVFFLAMGAANLFVAYNFDESTWVDFKLFGMMGLTFTFVIAQAFFLARHMPEDKRTGEDP
jgi:intracellular septation protein A